MCYMWGLNQAVLVSACLCSLIQTIHGDVSPKDHKCWQNTVRFTQANKTQWVDDIFTAKPKIPDTLRDKGCGCWYVQHFGMAEVLEAQPKLCELYISLLGLYGFQEWEETKYFDSNT